MASTRDELFAAIEAGEVERIRALLAADPSLAGARDPEGVSALMRARYRLDRGAVQALIEAGPDLDLFEAAAFGDVDRLTALLGAEAGPDAVSPDGFTPLHLAAFFGKPAAAALLLRRGAEVDPRGRGWMTGTPLHSAVSGRHVDVIEILLAAGADPNARQSGGWTPLHGAAHNGDVASVALLLAAGADPSALNDDGASVLSLAEEQREPATIEAVRVALRAGQAP
jgi:ankyrin repeat protein